MKFFSRMKGKGRSPARVGGSEVLWSWIGAFLGIAAVGYLHEMILGQSSLVMIIGSFGATAVLIYGAPKSPLAQPRNLIGRHMI